MDSKLTEDEIRQLALVYAHAKFSQYLQSDTPRSRNAMRDYEMLELSTLTEFYNSAKQSLRRVDKWEFT